MLSFFMQVIKKGPNIILVYRIQRENSLGDVATCHLKFYFCNV